MEMPFERPGRADIRAMVRLAVPVVVVQVGMMLFGVVDTMVVGRLSSQALAAVALGHVAVITVSSFGVGVILGLDPLLNQALGARDRNAFRRSVQRGIALAGMLMVPTTLLLLPIGGVLALLGQPPETVPLATAYAHISIPGMLPFYGWVVFRLALQAMGRLRPIVATVIAVNLFNLVADWALVFGAGPIPQLGPIGSAWASTIARTLLFVVIFVIDREDLGPLLRFDREAFRWRPLVRTIRLGLPIGFHLQLEIIAFSVIAVLMGGLGTTTMAAHQVAINLASLTFMVPLGVSQATAVRVGNAIGAGDSGGARRAASSGLLLGAGFMTLTGLLFIGAPTALARAYTSVNEVLVLAAALIPIAGFFQVVDGLQVVAAGVLRGAGDTRAPLVVNLLGFWLIGLPTSLVLGFTLDFGPRGLWWGLVAGLTAVATFLLIRVAWRLHGAIERVQVD
ncbi:MAG: MATE family efflux transporter [Thermoanaerobaculales bacterium]|jgi:MATE family multidrug resistance protein|nr:MATE family efflux transporter [Thermoanaerobaculales bacterium]